MPDGGLVVTFIRRHRRAFEAAEALERANATVETPRAQTAPTN